MALELVGGAFLDAFLNMLLDRIATPEIINFFKTKKLNQKFLKRLKIKLLSVHGVLEDAEGKQFKNTAVKEWLDELKGASFDAEDLLDEIYTRITTEVLNSYLPSKYSCESETELEQNIREILEKLEFLGEEKDALRLQEGIGTKWSSKTPTTSLVEESGVYGRDNDKENMVRLLLSEDTNGKKICVIPIVGMSGIGKTTLAQLVYNDQRVKDKFEVKAWVWVSEEFDIVMVTKTILEAITSHAFATNDLNSLQVELKERLNGKRFFIVLDDVWIENYDEWCHLQSPFQYGAQGSTIIVTTRSGHVASIMQTTQYHNLEHLSDEDCWNLFAKHAFDYKNSTKQPILEEIGRKIAKKCNGLPLAAKTLGGLLRSKDDIEEWDNTLKSDIWNLANNESNIIPALRLSYYYLPSHLKRCFAYCSIFPKGYEFNKIQLIILWMAENLLPQPKGNKRIEEVGEECFQQLVSRSFFQQSKRDKSCFVMHDLINDLARCVSGKFCIRLESEYSYQEIETSTRHLSLVVGDNCCSVNYEGIKEKNFEDIYRGSHLRTFLPLGQLQNQLKELKLQETFSKLRFLRVLSLKCFPELEELPNSIGLLRHLRYLDVSETDIKWLHESICNLHNLQTLMAWNCLQLSMLPERFHNLINLRYLEIMYSPLKRMPPHMGQLRSLQELSDFIVGEKCGSSLGELGQLVHLRGSLSIRNLQYIVDVEEAKKAKLKDKEYLEYLYLDWTMDGSDTDTHDSYHEKDVLENLQPHTRNLKELEIINYMGTTFPNWLGDTSFCNLVSVSLKGCKYCCVLPPLGQLPSMKELSIKNIEGLVRVGPEFYWSCSMVNAKQPFASLEILWFKDMSAWETWSSVVDSESYRAFPCLRELHITDCPALTGDLPSNIPFFTKLTIENCPSLEFSAHANADEYLQSLECLKQMDISNL